MFWSCLVLVSVVAYLLQVAYPALISYLSPVLMPFFAIPFIKVGVTLLFLVVGFWIVFRKLLPILQDPSQVKALGNRFERARNLPTTTAKVTLQKKARVVIVTLNLLKGVETTVIFQERLMSLSADDGIQSSARLSLNFPSAEQTMFIDGDRREIAWLCNELSEWSGMKVKSWGLFGPVEGHSDG